MASGRGCYWSLTVVHVKRGLLHDIAIFNTVGAYMLDPNPAANLMLLDLLVL